MRLFLNETALQGQFDQPETFKSWIEEVMRARMRSPYMAQMRTTHTVTERPVSVGVSFRDAVMAWGKTPLRSAVLLWVANQGPFIEADRQPEADDLFYCKNVDVTDGGLGEAARRQKGGELVGAVSVIGGELDFSGSPLTVQHGLQDMQLGSYDIENFIDIKGLLQRLAIVEPPANSWRQMVEHARARFPNLLFPDALYTNDKLAREPFDTVIRDRFYALMQHLDAYMADRPSGTEGARAREVIQQTFHGDRALFTGESQSNREAFEREMTFPDPSAPDRAIFAHWHGKISHRYFRIHFEWPVPANAPQLKVLYIGPKLTKS